MVFSSINFIFIFLPIFFICYYIMPKKIKDIILILGSLTFYFIGTVGHLEHFIIFILSILMDYAAGLLMDKKPRRKKLYLTLAIIAFSFQIYFDFWGYSLMAIGLGKMLGFNLSKNFDFPYLSLSMTEFWRRWHITLGRWFREYVYIPLGGNKGSKVRIIRNLFIVWMLTGIWHGAGYNYILWGFILFCLITIEKLFIGKYLNKSPILGHLYMILCIPLSWMIFAINDMTELKIFFTRLFPFFGQGVWSVFRYDYLKYLKIYSPFLVIGLLFCTKLPFNLLSKIKKKYNSDVTIEPLGRTTKHERVEA